MVPQDWLYWSFQEFMRLYFELYVQCIAPR
jgi:hypothetical protein